MTLSSDGGIATRRSQRTHESSMERWRGLLAWVLFALVPFAIASHARADALETLAGELRAQIDAMATAALERIEGGDRQLLATRSYLRGGPDLAAQWSWTDAEIAAYAYSAEYRDVQADADKVVAAFEAANPGYQLYVNREVRSLDVQLGSWNENPSVAAAAAELHAAALAESANPAYTKPSSDAAIARFRAFLLGWYPSEPVSVAAPGLSPHGQLRALDFQVQKGDRIVASTSAADAVVQWDAEGWTEKLKQAVTSASPRMQGPLESPREPWHYSYAP